MLDVGGLDKTDLNFYVETPIGDGTEVFRIYPLMAAVAKGSEEIIDLLLSNSTLDVNVHDPDSGVNSFWLACLYGHGKIMRKLVNRAADIYVTN